MDPKCKELIGCLESGIWDNHREAFEESEVYGHYDALAAYRDWETDRKSTRLNSSHRSLSRMPSSA